MARNDDSNKSYVGMLGCPRCGKATGVILDRHLRNTFENGKTYADGDVCDECKEEIAMHEKVVSEGGIYFRCKKCKQEGVIKYEGSSEGAKDLIRMVREKQFGKDTSGWMSNPVGIEFSTCEEHGV